MSESLEGTPPKDPIGVFVGIASYRNIDAKAVGALWNTFVSVPGFNWGLSISDSGNIPQNRNMIVDKFLEAGENYKYLLYIDSDMLWQPDQVARLIESIESKPDAGAVAGFYLKRDGSLTPLCAWVTEDDPLELIPAQENLDRILDNRGNLVQADLLPTGFMIIRREVFKDLEEPYFSIMFPKKSSQMWSSDSVFCHKLREAGWQTYMDLGIEVGHVGTFVWVPELFYQAAAAGRNSARVRAFTQDMEINSGEYWNFIYKEEAKTGTVRDLIFPALDKISGYIPVDSRVLDLGCGTGNFANFSNAELTGVDISTYACEQATAKGYTTTKCLDLNTEELDYKDEFDFVVSCEFLEHIPQPGRILSMARKALKPGGRVFFTVPADRLGPEEEPEHYHKFNQAALGKLFLTYFKNVEITRVTNYWIVSAFKGE